VVRELGDEQTEGVASAMSAGSVLVLLGKVKWKNRACFEFLVGISLGIAENSKLF
jgi:hypothetical protein